MQMRSRKHRQQGRKHRSRRSLKGGAGPYTYEDVSLSVGNPLIQIAVMQEDDGTYSFNVPAGGMLEKKVEPFKNYCKLAQYYQANVPLACVNPSFINSGGKNMMVPSLVKILGLALLLQNEKVRIQQIKTLTATQMQTCMDALILVANSSRSLFTATDSGCIVSEDFKKISKNVLENYEFYNVSGLSKDDVDSILKFFKIAMFYYKFGVLPEQYLGELSFNAILMDDPKSMEKYIVGDKTTIKANIAGNPFQLYKKMFYTQENLSAPAPVSSSAPAPVASSAPVESKSIDARLDALEREVAQLKKQIGS
jgi:hypothetical protein